MQLCVCHRNNRVGVVPPSNPVGSKCTKNMNDSPDNEIILDRRLNIAGSRLEDNKYDPARVPGVNANRI